MFGPRNSRGSEGDTSDNSSPLEINSPIRTSSSIETARPSSPMVTPRRVVVESLGGRRVASNEISTERKLTVGRGISMAGEIASCDILVVEGKVEAKLTEGKLIEITDAGQFRGSVEIENADIAGHFDGQLIVHGRLTVRSTGRINGSVKYGELDVNAGGQITGDMQVMGHGTQQTNIPPYKSNAKVTTLLDEVEMLDGGEDTKAEKRKSA